MIQAIREAAERIEAHVVRTPLLRSEALDAATGGRIFLKAENLQVTGSFKARGAANALLSLSEAERVKGILAFSSGNHAQAVARMAQRLGLPARILMPSDTPPLKVERTQAWGAEVRTYDRLKEDREEVAARLREGRALIPPFDLEAVVMGQGTAGLEASAQLAALGAKPEAYLCCTGGGGLLAGSSLALFDAFPGLAAYAVEPEGFDDWARSLKSGKRERNATLGGSVCDAIVTPSPGQVTWPLIGDKLTGGLVVTDAEALAAVRWAFVELKLVLEPGGAVALAAALTGRLDLRGKTALVMLSGGNLDPTLAREVLG